MGHGKGDLDRDLILQVREGHTDSFRPLVERYWVRVKGLARKMVRDDSTVEDICQETFLKAFEKLGQFDANREFAPWLLRIAVNLIGEHYRRLGRSLKLVPLDDAAVPSGAPGPGDEVMSRLLFDQCLEGLPPGYRMLFALRHGLMLSYEEISQLLDEPLGTVKVGLFRARELLKKLMVVSDRAGGGAEGGDI
ncbi:MAG TPA: RNA polymerase sigma factor [Candidatus Ozemobacteraceae bacterium]|nr:RNA polymerase sigma factor [Candidatus Ozemobacteraceae bacterium]